MYQAVLVLKLAVKVIFLNLVSLLRRGSFIKKRSEKSKLSSHLFVSARARKRPLRRRGKFGCMDWTDKVNWPP